MEDAHPLRYLFLFTRHFTPSGDQDKAMVLIEARTKEDLVAYYHELSNGIFEDTETGGRIINKDIEIMRLENKKGMVNGGIECPPTVQSSFH